MISKRKPPFDPKVFLSKVNGGRAISDYRKDQIVYTGRAILRIPFSTFRAARSRRPSSPSRARKPWSHFWEPTISLVKGAWPDSRCVCQPVSAMTQCVIVRIAKADIIRVIHEEPAFAELFIAHLLARNIRVEEDLVDQLFNSSEKRLARVLLLLANFGKEGRPEPILAKISQETLAEMIGTTRSRVSFFMNKFRELGLIDYNGHIEVHSSLLNVVLHDNRRLRAEAFVRLWPICCGFSFRIW
jgi:CRP/FNR family cyclic AMP-dependent transcriptional regulator